MFFSTFGLIFWCIGCLLSLRILTRDMVYPEQTMLREALLALFLLFCGCLFLAL